MFPTLIYGGDYNPDQWSEEVWLEDARLMREAGVNMVSLGIFSWARLEPAPGQFDFGWLDRVMDVLHAHGVRVNLATPTASPPPWLVRLHPEILPVTAEGVTLWHGSRRHYCPHSPAYRTHAARIATQVAQHARAHPALAMWHVDNEYACHVSECFCEVSAAAFRNWLRARYGSLEGLNNAWGTAFWSQHYAEWEEIVPPRRAPASNNPSQVLDWQRFSSDSWRACFEEQKAILREITPAVPITTNFMGFFKPVDYWRWAAAEDLVANDAYPDTSDPDWMVAAGMTCDLMRSLKNEAWLLMEQAPTHVNWRQRNATKRPGVMRLGSYQALARGANGIMFFQWRASRAGSEKHHSAMLPHGGTATRVWHEVKTLGAELARLEALCPSRLQPEAAIVFDWENWWALENSDKPSNDLKLLPAVTALYAEFFRRNIAVDFAQPEADLSRYRLVLAPHLYLVTDRAAENIMQYVAEGGTLLMSFFSGLVDANDHIRLGGSPAPFRDLLGLWVEESAPHAEWQTNIVDTRDGRQFKCDLWSDVIHTTGAETLAQFGSDYFAGRPAITRHTFGQGRSFYVGTALEAAGLSWLVDRVCAEAGVRALHLPRGVESVTRTDGAHTWQFILNHSDETVDLAQAEGGRDLLSRALVAGTLRLEPRGVAVVERPAGA